MNKIMTAWKNYTPSRRRILLASASLMVLIASLIALRFVYQRDTDYDIDALRAVSIEDVINRVKSSEPARYERFYVVDQGFEHPGNPPIDWDWQVKENRTNNFHLHSWDHINESLIAFDETRELKLLKEANMVASDWIAENDAELINNQEGNFAWYDMAVGIRLYRLAYILDQSIRTEVVSEDELETMWRSIIDHLHYLKNDKNIIFHNNHGIFQAAGQKVTARRFLSVDKKQFSKVSDEATNRLLNMLKSQFSEEGIHKEHSPHYHRLAYEMFLKIKKEDLLNNNEVSRILSRAGDAMYWMIKPNDQFVNFGDTDYRHVPRQSDRYYDESSTLLRHYATNGSEGEAPNTSLACYKDSGFAAVKHRDSYLGQQAAFHSRTHKHADDLTIAWYDKGQDLLIDSGKYGYLDRSEVGSQELKDGFWYSDPKRIYVEKTRAHNTVEIDNSDYDRVNREPFGSALRQCGQSDDGIYFIESEVEHSGEIIHNRLLLFAPDEWLVVVDKLTASDDAEHNYKQWFHFAEDMTLTKNGENLEVTSNNLEQELYMTELLTDRQTGIGPIRGQTDPYLQGWYSPDSGIFKPSPAFAFEKEGKGRVSFATLIAFDSEGVNSAENNSLAEDGGSFVWQESSIHKMLNFSYGTNGEIHVEFSENSGEPN